MIVNEGASLLAVAPFGTAVEGQNPGSAGGIGVLGRSRAGTGVRGTTEQ
ncbi:MAG: hypothetical protein ACREV3_14395 [Gammaproteobacteria bacterium]